MNIVEVIILIRRDDKSEILGTYTIVSDDVEELQSTIEGMAL